MKAIETQEALKAAIIEKVSECYMLHVTARLTCNLVQLGFASYDFACWVDLLCYVLCCDVLRCAVLCCAVFLFAVLYSAVLHCALLYSCCAAAVLLLCCVVVWCTLCCMHSHLQGVLRVQSGHLHSCILYLLPCGILLIQ